MHCNNFSKAASIWTLQPIKFLCESQFSLTFLFPTPSSNLLQGTSLDPGPQQPTLLWRIHKFKMCPVHKQVSTMRAQSLDCLSGVELTVGIIKNPDTQCTGLHIYLH